MSVEKRPIIYYLHAEFTVRRENHRAFETLMTRLMSVIYELFGWELVQATYPVTGAVNRFSHVWKISDPDTILRIMRHGAFDDYGVERVLESAARTSYEEPLSNYFKRVYREIQKVVENTSHQLTTSLPHDPNHAGDQSQTLLIDRDGDIFIMEHAEMRGKWGKDQRIDGPLMQARQRRNSRLWGTAQEEENARHRLLESVAERPYLDRPSDREQKDYDSLLARLREIQDALEKELNERRGNLPQPHSEIVTIQNLLNEGVTHAKVEHKGKAALLVNLAALKARPILQQSFDITKHVREKYSKDSVTLAAKAGNGRFDAFERLVIATPWGSVYSVNAADIKAVAQEIKEDDATRVRVAPIVEHGATLASVLEAPDEVIGDGCVCYVINLSSFTAEARDRSQYRFAKELKHIQKAR